MITPVTLLAVIASAVFHLPAFPSWIPVLLSMAQFLSRVVIWATVALVVFWVLVPAQGLYFAFFNVSHPLFYWDCLALVLIAAWGAFGSQPLLVRFSGSLALASLIVANIAFSGAPFRVLSISDGLAILGAFWLLPWLLLWSLRSIPRVGLQLGKQHDGEVRVVQRPWNTRDLLATVCFAAVIFLDHFATADALELALMFAGPLEPEDAREIAARPNVVTLALSCAGIQAEAVAALRDAENLKTVYYRDDWNPQTLALLRRELAGVEILPLSTRKSSP